MKNSIIILSLIVSIVVFQLTLLRHIWGIETLSRTFNALFIIITFCSAGYSIFRIKLSLKTWCFFQIPALLIVIGTLINLGKNSVYDIGSIIGISWIMSWMLFLSIPILLNTKIIDMYIVWNITYYVMIVVVALGLFDYLLIYVRGFSGKMIETDYGVFLAGNFSLLHMLEDGLPHFRFYASFAEPGNLAMWLIPFIGYGIYYKKPSALILLVGFFLTYSLGGIISLILYAFITLFKKIKVKYSHVFFSILFFSILILYMPNIFETLEKSISNKGSSFEVRQESFKRGIRNYADLAIAYPFGIDATMENKNIQKKYGNLFSGTNFIPILYHYNGGFVAMIGYLIILLSSFLYCLFILIKKNNFHFYNQIVPISIITTIPFLLQRTTIFETSLFALLYYPFFLINLNECKPKTV